MRTGDARHAGGSDVGGEPGDGVNPLVVAHRLLRGRYWWAIGLSVLLGGPLAWVGYTSKTPMYTSEAIVRIAPTQSPILFQTEQNEAIPYFDQYVSSQAALMANPQALGAVLMRPEVLGAGWEGGTRGVAALRRAVSVRAPARAGMIYLSVAHTEPLAAERACAALLAQFEESHRNDTRTNFNATVRALENRRDDKAIERDRARAEVRRIAEAFGSEHLQPVIDGFNRELTDLDVHVARVRAALAARGVPIDGATDAGSGGATQEPGSADDPAVEPVPLEMLAERDQELADLVRTHGVLEAEIEFYTGQYSPRHLEVTRRQSDLARVAQLIERRASILRRQWGQHPDVADATTNDLRLQLAQFRQQRADLFERLSRLTQAQTEMEGHQRHADRAESERLEAVRRRDELITENSDARLGRLEVIHDATLPTEPSSDKRLMFAAAGAMAGGGFGFGLIALLGLLGGGFRYIDEIDEESSQLLGVIPDLGGRREPTPEAALCIHHARAMIDSRVPRVKERGRIIAVTSPTAGDGKTTVCCSLATSFAMSGFRTVVIDADFVGRGMTSRLEMDNAAGLADVLAGDDLESALSPGGTENLLIVGAGREERLSADRFSAARLAPVLDRLSRAHDIVLVDSGPVLGSIEATVTVGLADAVLGVVSRGQSERMFASMRRKLASLGAELTGVVFNRAKPRDFQHSTHTSVVSAQSQRSRTVQVPDFVTMGTGGQAGLDADGSGDARRLAVGQRAAGRWGSSREQPKSGVK